MRRMVLILVHVLYFFAMALSVNARAAVRGQYDENLLSVLRAGYSANGDAINTFSATMLVEEVNRSDKKRSKFFECQYWRTPKAIRYRESYFKGSIEDGLQTATERKQVSKNLIPGQTGYRYGATREHPHTSMMAGDVWASMLIEFPNGKGGQCDLERFLELAKKPPAVSKERLDGQDCIRLSMRYDDVRSGEVQLDAWFDPRVNYLVRKRVMVWGKFRSESRIESFQRFGEWSFPKVCVGDYSISGKAQSGQSIATFSDIKVNTPLPENIFRLAVPHGTMLFDQFDNTRYLINERWERIGARTNTPPVKRNSPQSDGDAPAFTEQSRDEPPPRTRWLLWGSLGLLGAGGGVWAWRNRGRLKRRAG